MTDAKQVEMAVLGTILNDNSALENASQLRTNHFLIAAHKTIFAAIFTLVSTQCLADAITVSEHLQGKGQLSEIGGMMYLHDLTQAASSARSLPRYVEIILDRAAKRTLVECCRVAIEQASGNDTCQQLLDQLNASLENIRNPIKTGDLQFLRDLLPSYIDLMQSRSEKKEIFTSSGLKALDKKLGGGFSAGDLVIVAGRPAMGKTAFCLTVAHAQTLPVALFSMEMSNHQLIDRSVSMAGSVALNWVRSPTEDDTPSWNRFSAAIQELGKSNLLIDETPAQSLIDMRSKARRVKRKHGLGLIIVDYMGLMSGAEKNSNRNQEVGEFSRGLKALAKEMSCPVLALAQLSRKCEERVNKRPLMSDLRDSGEIEQDADTILMLYRDEVYHPDSMDKGVAEIGIVKQRQGEISVVGSVYRGEYTRFDDLAHEWKPAEPKPKKGGFSL